MFALESLDDGVLGPGHSPHDYFDRLDRFHHGDRLIAWLTGMSSGCPQLPEHLRPPRSRVEALASSTSRRWPVPNQHEPRSRCPPHRDEDTTASEVPLRRATIRLCAASRAFRT